MPQKAVWETATIECTRWTHSIRCKIGSSAASLVHIHRSVLVTPGRVVVFGCCDSDPEVCDLDTPEEFLIGWRQDHDLLEWWSTVIAGCLPGVYSESPIGLSDRNVQCNITMHLGMMPQDEDIGQSRGEGWSDSPPKTSGESTGKLPLRAPARHEKKNGTGAGGFGDKSLPMMDMLIHSRIICRVNAGAFWRGVN